MDRLNSERSNLPLQEADQFCVVASGDNSLLSDVFRGGASLGVLERALAGRTNQAAAEEGGSMAAESGHLWFLVALASIAPMPCNGTVISSSCSNQHPTHPVQTVTTDRSITANLPGR